MRSVVLALLFVLAVAPAASAAPAWLPPFDVGTGGFGRVAVNPSGDAVAIWRRSDGTDFIAQVATRRAGEPLSAGFDVSAGGASVAGFDVAVNGYGDAVAVWTRGGVVQAATGQTGSRLAAPVDVSVGAGASALDVAIDDTGAIVVVWMQGGRIKTSSRPVLGSFSPPADLSAQGLNVDSPRVAANATGDTVALWRRHTPGAVIQASVRAPGGAFSLPDDVSAPGGSAETPQVAVDGRGDGLAVWRALNGTVWEIRAASQPRGQGFDGGVSVSGLGKNVHSPQVAAGGAGDAVVAWAREKPGPPGSPDEIQAATRSAGGSFTAPADVSGGTPGGPSTQPQVVMDPAGDAVVAWRRMTTMGNPALQASTRPAGGTFSPVVDVSAPGAYVIDLHLAMDGAGDALAVWTAIPPGGTEAAVQAGVYDASPPQLSGLVVPATGVVGRPVSFSALPFDAWSAVSTTWSFGDGGVGSGAAATHTYAAPGTYGVAVTVRDAAGTAVGDSREITISAPPAGRVAPMISRLRVSPSAFSRRARVTYRLDRAATVRFRILRRSRGGRLVAARSFARVSKAGRNRLALRRRTLRPGRYRLTAVPTAGGVRGGAARAAFRVRTSGSRAGS